MDHQVGLLEFEPDDLQQIPGAIGSDGKHLGWVGVWLEVENGDGMFEGVTNGGVVDAVFVSGAMDFHIKSIIVIRNFWSWKIARMGASIPGGIR